MLWTGGTANHANKSGAVTPTTATGSGSGLTLKNVTSSTTTNTPSTGPVATITFTVLDTTVAHADKNKTNVSTTATSGSGSGLTVNTTGTGVVTAVSFTVNNDTSVHADKNATISANTLNGQTEYGSGLKLTTTGEGRVDTGTNNHVTFTVTNNTTVHADKNKYGVNTTTTTVGSNGTGLRLTTTGKGAATAVDLTSGGTQQDNDKHLGTAVATTAATGSGTGLTLDTTGAGKVASVKDATAGTQAHNIATNKKAGAGVPTTSTGNGTGLRLNTTYVHNRVATISATQGGSGVTGASGAELSVSAKGRQSTWAKKRPTLSRKVDRVPDSKLRRSGTLGQVTSVDVTKEGVIAHADKDKNGVALTSGSATIDTTGKSGIVSRIRVYRGGQCLEGSQQKHNRTRRKLHCGQHHCFECWSRSVYRRLRSGSGISEPTTVTMAGDTATLSPAPPASNAGAVFLQFYSALTINERLVVTNNQPGFQAIANPTAKIGTRGQMGALAHSYYQQRGNRCNRSIRTGKLVYRTASEHRQSTISSRRKDLAQHLHGCAEWARHRVSW